MYPEATPGWVNYDSVADKYARLIAQQFEQAAADLVSRVIPRDWVVRVLDLALELESLVRKRCELWRPEVL